MAYFHASFISLNTVLLVFTLSLHNALAASLAEWRNRSIYQVLTDRFAYGNGSESAPVCEVELGLYCGGTWQSIKANLDYIQGMNFDAIWISPVVAQLPQRTGDGEAYTAYWQQDLYSLNPKFGTDDDLKDLVNAVHDRGMLLMLDIVVNHFAYADPGEEIDFSVFNPFNDAKYFHEYCDISNPENLTNVQVCWLGDYMVPLVDLRTEDEEVQQMYGDWISELVSNYSIDGLRIDTAINVDAPFFVDFVEAAGVFATGEVMQGDDSLACQWADTIGSILNYPVYYTLTRAFQDPTGSINDLVDTINSVKANCKDPTSLGSFSESHDVPRFANYTQDMALAKNIITYTILADGIPIIYQGQEQHMNGDIDPYTNRAPLWDAGYNTSAPLYQHIATLNNFRQHVISASDNYTGYLNDVIYQDYHSLGMRKGFAGSQVITILNNNGETVDDFNLAVPNHGFFAGDQLTEVLTCTNLTVNETGYINLPMGQGQPKIMYPSRLLYNSSLCGMPDRAPASVSTTVPELITTTIGGHSTVLHTETVSPVMATTTSNPNPTPGPHDKPPPKALGTGDHRNHDMPMMLSAAVAATVISSGFLPSVARMLGL